jgi:hypothetical protein
MRASLKALLVLEVVVCFGPMTLMLMIGTLLVPIQIAALFYEPLLWEGPVQVIGMVLSGAVGLTTLLYLLDKLFDASEDEIIDRPLLVLAGAIVGALPLLDAITSPHLGWRILGAMPIVAGIHLILLSRKLLFPVRAPTLRRFLLGRRRFGPDGDGRGCRDRRGRRSPPEQ